MARPGVPVRGTAALAALVARVADHVRRYDALGWHRSGDAAESATCQWLAEEAAIQGLTCEIQPYGFERVDVSAAWLEVDGRRIEGLPLFDAAFTPTDGVSGRLGAFDSDADIRVAFLPAGDGTGGVRVPRPNGDALALIAVTMGDRPGLCPKNAHAYEEPFGPPTLQVSSVHAEEIAAWVREGRQARVVASAVRTGATGYNVLARVPGAEQAPAPLVVMTPLTGWWHCAAERGGGIACWLEALRALGAAPPCPVVLIATGGHELGDLGLRRLLSEEPALARDAVAWVRLGADIGAASPGGISLASSDKGLIEAAKAELAKVGLAPAEVSREGRAARQLLIRGENEFFHHPDDRWPESVDVHSLGRQAAAYAALVVRLAGSGEDSRRQG